MIDVFTCKGGRQRVRNKLKQTLVPGHSLSPPPSPIDIRHIGSCLAHQTTFTRAKGYLSCVSRSIPYRCRPRLRRRSSNAMLWRPLAAESRRAGMPAGSKASREQLPPVPAHHQAPSGSPVQCWGRAPSPSRFRPPCVVAVPFARPLAPSTWRSVPVRPTAAPSTPPSMCRQRWRRWRRCWTLRWTPPACMSSTWQGCWHFAPLPYCSWLPRAGSRTG